MRVGLELPAAPDGAIASEWRFRARVMMRVRARVMIRECVH